MFVYLPYQKTQWKLLFVEMCKTKITDLRSLGNRGALDIFDQAIPSQRNPDKNRNILLINALATKLEVSLDKIFSRVYKYPAINRLSFRVGTAKIKMSFKLSITSWASLLIQGLSHFSDAYVRNSHSSHVVFPKFIDIAATHLEQHIFKVPLLRMLQFSRTKTLALKSETTFTWYIRYASSS